MPYTQKWGISRNAFQSPLNNDDPAKTFSTEEDMPPIPEVNTDPNSNEDIITQNNKKAELENAKNILSTFAKKNTGGNPVVSKKPTTIGGPEWEAKQKEVYETDSAWDQAGTLFKNPFQGASAFMQQIRRGAQGLIGNEYADAGTGSSLTSLRRSKEAKSKGANVHIPGGILNSASQWVPAGYLASSLHQGFTGAGEMATGNVKKGAGNIAGGLYSYIPGLKQIKGKGTWFSGSPQIQNFLNKGVESISKSNFGRNIWNFMDKGGTYGYKVNKIKEQSS